MVIVNLMLQSILILIGNKRKHSTRNWLRFILWLAYLSADWVATISLSVLSIKHLQYHEDDYSTNPNYIVRRFGRLLFSCTLVVPRHRHHVFLGRQSSMVETISHAISAGGSGLSCICPSLNFQFAQLSLGPHSSSDYFRKSMFPFPDPGTNYARYMEKYRSKKAEGFRVSLRKIIEAPTVGDHIYAAPENTIVRPALQDAYTFFNTFKCLFANLILSVHDKRTANPSSRTELATRSSK